jgi:hypothetical protein
MTSTPSRHPIVMRHGPRFPRAPQGGQQPTGQARPPDVPKRIYVSPNSQTSDMLRVPRLRLRVCENWELLVQDTKSHKGRAMVRAAHEIHTPKHRGAGEGSLRVWIEMQARIREAEEARRPTARARDQAMWGGAKAGSNRPFWVEGGSQNDRWSAAESFPRPSAINLDHREVDWGARGAQASRKRAGAQRTRRRSHLPP